MVSVPQFVLGMYEVTVAQWKMCVADQACAFVPAGQGDAEPVAGVGWYDAQEYIEWLSQKSGRQYRLPTEAEWEFAARAGSTTPFWTGYRVNPRDANYDTSKDYNSSNTDTPFGKVRDAGAYRPNAYGLYDVIGNVQEWVEDCFDTYAKAPTDGRPSLGASARSAPCSKAVRGGSWRSPPAAVRSAWREALFPSARISDAGFRVARDF
jgi:formylglycine-generating enzyme required for sulfatase activity